MPYRGSIWKRQGFSWPIAPQLHIDGWREMS
jgi:hypothetical protein